MNERKGCERGKASTVVGCALFAMAEMGGWLHGGSREGPPRRMEMRGTRPLPARGFGLMVGR